MGWNGGSDLGGAAVAEGFGAGLYVDSVLGGSDNGARDWPERVAVFAGGSRWISDGRGPKVNTPVEGVVAGDLVGGWDSTKQTADWVVGLQFVIFIRNSPIAPCRRAPLWPVSPLFRSFAPWALLSLFGPSLLSFPRACSRSRRRCSPLRTFAPSAKPTAPASPASPSLALLCSGGSHVAPVCLSTREGGGVGAMGWPRRARASEAGETARERVRQLCILARAWPRSGCGSSPSQQGRSEERGGLVPPPPPWANQV